MIRTPTYAINPPSVFFCRNFPLMSRLMLRALFRHAIIRSPIFH